jgi:hypothetical protein
VAFQEELYRRGVLLRFTSELLFSLYFSTLLVAVEEHRGFSWSTQFRLWYFAYRHPSAPKPIDSPHFERMIAFILAWLFVVAVFMLLRFLHRLSAVSDAVQWTIGFVALAGLPGALLCDGYGNRKTLLVLIGVGVFVSSVCVFRPWRMPNWMSLILLGFYSICTTWVAWESWTTFPLPVFAVWPGLDWVLGTYPAVKNIVPLLGFLLVVAWFMWVNQARGHKPVNETRETNGTFSDHIRTTSL